MRVLVVLLLALVGAAVGLAPLARAPNPNDRVPDQYIVMYRQNATKADVEADFLRITTLTGVKMDSVWTKYFKGFSAKMTARQLAVVRANPNVEHVEEDQIVWTTQCLQQNNAPSWGLNRVGTRDLNPNGIFNYPANLGAGVTAYIIDTGVYLQHNDFGGRATFGYKSEPGWSNNDNNGHGTHVASTVGGNLYGIAKGVAIVAVKVLGDNGSGTITGVINGVDWAHDDHVSNTRASVGNMSLGGGQSAALNQACNLASQAGMNLIVAAGNENNNACTRSPASADFVVSTGSTDIGAGPGGEEEDVRSYFSNYGTCVAIFAPGSDITGAWIGSPSASRTISGTSMASPHVCGIAATLISANPNWSFNTLYDNLRDLATPDIINLNCGNSVCLQSPNLMAFDGC